MLIPFYTRQFEWDLKRLQEAGRSLDQLKTVIRTLTAVKPLPRGCRDHKLVGNWHGRRECHIGPDWLLIYKVEADRGMIIFERTGSHADLFE